MKTIAKLADKLIEVSRCKNGIDWYTVAIFVYNRDIEARIEELHNFTFYGDNRKNIKELSERLDKLQTMKVKK